MTRCGLVAENVWLAIAWPCPGTSVRERLAQREGRWARDRAAAARAETAALTVAAAAGLEAQRCAVSRSHTLGVGAALVGAESRRLGVDLVPLGRVSERHARALLGPREWTALTSASAAPSALAWALKEAAAKASGDPMRHFPHGPAIEHAGRGLRVRIAALAMVLAVDWLLLGDVLCAYAWEVTTSWSATPAPASRPARWPDR